MPAVVDQRKPTMLDRLNDALDFQGQALQLRSERQRLIASNIANADTPGYVARDMDFAKTLRAATGTLPATVSALARLEATTLSRWLCALAALPEMLKIDSIPISAPAIDR